MIQLPPEPQTGQPVTAAWARQVCRAIKALVPKPSRYILPNVGTGGTTYEIRGVQTTGARAEKHNFYVTLIEEGETLKAIVADGSISGVTPTMGGGEDPPAIDEDPPPMATISDTGTVKGWFKITVEPYVVNKGTIASPVYRIAGGNVTEVEIVFDETEPEGENATVDVDTGETTAGTYVRRFVTIHDGEVVRPQPVRYSLSALLCDNGESEGLLTLGVGL